MENRIQKNRYNGGATSDADKHTDKPDVLKKIEAEMDKSAADIAVTVSDMFKFMAMTAAMLPNMELDVGVFCLNINDDGISFELHYPADFKRTRSNDSGIAQKVPDNDDDEEG